MVLRKMDQTMITDITLDHLPDLSEENVSFEIPKDNFSADLLADATGFNVLYSTMDADASFAPVAHLAAHMNHRRPTLALAELTPRAEPTTCLPTRSSSLSAMPGPTLSISQPSEIPQPPTLRRSPRKRRETPSRALSQPRYLPLESALPSEEPFDLLRADGQTLGRVHEESSSSSHLDVDPVAHDKDLPVRGRKTPSRSRSKRSQPVSEHHLDHLSEIDVLDQGLVAQPSEAIDVVAHDTDLPTKRRRTPSRAGSKRSMRLVSEEHLDQIPEAATLGEDLQQKSREDGANAVAQDTDAAVKRRRTPSRSPSKRRSQLVSEQHLSQIPEAETIGWELDTQPCQDLDVVAHDKADSRRRSKTPSRARSDQGLRLVSEEHLFPIPELQTLDRHFQTQVYEDSDATAHGQHILVKDIDTPSCGSHLENPPISEEQPPAQVVVAQTSEQALETQIDQDVVMVPSETDGVDTRETIVPAVLTPPKAKLERNPRKPTVVAGGISKVPALPKTRVSKKTKSKPSSVREARPPPSSTAGRASPPQSLVAIDTAEKLVPPACIDGDIDMTSENTKITHPSTGGMAERLVSYSQKLISSIGLYKPWTEPTFTEDSSDAVRAAPQGETQPAATIPPPTNFPSPTARDILSVQEDPFRLSAISPQKLLSDGQPSRALHVGTLQDGWQRTLSPMQPAKKRHSMDVDLASQEQEQEQEQPRRKKGKSVLASADAERGSSEEASSQAQHCPDKNVNHEDQLVKKSTHNKTRPVVPKSVMPSARTKYRPRLEASPGCKGPTLRALPYMARSHQVSTVRPKSASGSSSASSRARRGETATQGKTLSSSSRMRQRSGPISTVNSALVENKPNATVSVALTKPVAFTFRVDARLEARKMEEKLAMSEPGKTCQDPGVPDFKAQHEAHQTLLAFRKENVVPSIPVMPFLFHTEQRAKEREKFDEMVRRKEEEMQRLKEEQRRLEAEDEERTIRELRQKAIPKANEMPEWYADMPKRKGTAV